ncbi:sensor histidine kinase [Brachybacterium halotolerans subsp. kimchii]|uniref:sensor histidine kinase n=1 Tax=Brachybacterium halotolerans TaxID=2795215 RepID=UPI001E4B4129|nr:sensor histidine kinase [Brachybacterium halotolerans]UEJ81979.1 sensor histidine kinase [Brachybacterium halotolerans subsp. kimchii]
MARTRLTGFARHGPAGATAPPIERCDEKHPRTLRGLHRAAIDSGAMFYTAPSLLFMLFVIIPAFDQPSVLHAAAIIALALAFSAVFLYLPGVKAYGPSVGYAYIGVVWALIALFVPAIGVNVLYMVMFVQIAHTIALPWRTARVVILPLTLAVCLVAVLTGEYIAIILALVGLMISLGVGYGIEREILTERLAQAEQRNAVLAVAAERERIGRDLHDILGHSLTTITVSSQLAQRLLASDPEAAHAQMAEVERISRQSLADVRATVSGMQEVRAATEIASARSVLTAAGIEADVPAALPELDDERAELFGYVIREGVTNVVRHSRATRCTIRVDEDSASVADDGVGIPSDRARSGLDGLARRVEEGGGELEVISDGEGAGTVITARLAPARRPLDEGAHHA